MRLLGSALLGLLLMGCSYETAQTAALPVSADLAKQIPRDPAVEYANELAGPGSPYRQGFSGEGDDRIHYVEAGEGPVILFVHGFPSFWYVWRDQMEALRRCRRVIAIDAPGAGLSAKPAADEAYKVENLAERLDRLIDELAPNEKIVLVGHDWGGALAWSYAQTNESKLDRLAVFSAPPYNLLLDLLATDPEQRAASAYMPTLLSIDRDRASTEAFAESFYDLAYKRMVDTKVLDEHEGALFRDALAREGAIYAGVQWYKANIPQFERLDPAQSYWPKAEATTSIPVLLVRGEEDRTFVKRMAERARPDAPELKVVELNGVAHWTPFQDPGAANRALFDFVMKAGELCR